MKLFTLTFVVQMRHGTLIDTLKRKYFFQSRSFRCQVKMSGEMMLSFPAGIVTILANNPNPAKLFFRVKNTQRLINVLPNKQLVAV